MRCLIALLLVLHVLSQSAPSCNPPEMPCACYDASQNPSQFCTAQCPPNAVSCPTFAWQTTSPMCPTDCGHDASNVTGTVFCEQTGGILTSPAPVADSMCDPRAKPTAPVMPCSATSPCVVYRWQEASDPCPTQCGSQQMTMPVTVTCMAYTSSTTPGTAVVDSYCAATVKPDTSKTCPATAPCVVHEWMVVDDRPCPSACGLPQSTITRTIVCRENTPGSTGGTTVTDSLCDITLRPDTTITCQATPVCVFYRWLVTGMCPTECGRAAGTVTVTVRCMSYPVATDGSTPGTNQGTEVVDSLCPTTKPPTTIYCQPTISCGTYRWFKSEPSCPTTCGTAASVVQVEVRCQSVTSNGATAVTDSFCATLTNPKPSSSANCPATAPCATYRWSDFPLVCPDGCGHDSSVITRDVVCWMISSASSSPVPTNDSYCLTPNTPKPVSERTCAATAPCAHYEWKTEMDHPCPTACGSPPSTTTCVVKCVDTTNGGNTQVDDSYCTTSTKPVASVYCTPVPPCVRYSWVTGERHCPTQCGLTDPTTTVEVTCQNFTTNTAMGTVVDQNFCDPSTRPNTIVTCSSTGACGQTSWFVAPPQCSTMCGSEASSVKVDVVCKSYTTAGMVSVVADSMCAGTKPSDMANCPATPPCAFYRWLAEHVECLTTCGNANTTIPRQVICNRYESSTSAGVPVADGFCDATTRPVDGIICAATPACGTYRWFEGPSVCPIACGQAASVVQRDVYCQRFTTGSNAERVADTYCLTSMPARTVPCQATVACVYYRWVITGGVCPMNCGSPAQNITRTVVCRSSATGTTTESNVDDSRCTETKPDTIVACMATAACVEYRWYASEVTCPTACGSAQTTRPRTVLCVSGANAATSSDESRCPAATRPDSTVVCPATAACVCRCDGPPPSLDVACVDGSKAGSSCTCTTTSPLVGQWSVSRCPEYHWLEGVWPDCPTPCGRQSSTVRRVVVCKSADGADVVDAFCPATTKPVVEKTCLATPACGNYDWRTGEAPACPTECGRPASSVTRTVNCYSFTSSTNAATQVDAGLCTASTRPTATVTCAATPACVTYRWNEPPFPACPTTCGAGDIYVQRQVACVTSNGAAVSPDHCPSTVPVSSKLCRNIVCQGHIVTFTVSGNLSPAQVDAVRNAIIVASEIASDRQTTINVTTETKATGTEFVVTIRSNAPDSAGTVQTGTAANNVAGATQSPSSALGQLGMMMSSPTVTTTNPSSSSSSSNTGAIVGAVVGVVVGLLVLGGIFLLCKAKKGVSMQ